MPKNIFGNGDVVGQVERFCLAPAKHAADVRYRTGGPKAGTDRNRPLHLESFNAPGRKLIFSVAVPERSIPSVAHVKSSPAAATA